jgi:hypothetical protein
LADCYPRPVGNCKWRFVSQKQKPDDKSL